MPRNEVQSAIFCSFCGGARMTWARTNRGPSIIITLITLSRGRRRLILSSCDTSTQLWTRDLLDTKKNHLRRSRTSLSRPFCYTRHRSLTSTSNTITPPKYPTHPPRQTHKNNHPTCRAAPEPALESTPKRREEVRLDHSHEYVQSTC